jgi:hypothetical protein
VAFYSPESIHLADILTITAIIIVGAIAVEAMALDDTVAADIVVVQRVDVFGLVGQECVVVDKALEQGRGFRRAGRARHRSMIFVVFQTAHQVSTHWNLRFVVVGDEADFTKSGGKKHGPCCTQHPEERLLHIGMLAGNRACFYTFRFPETFRTALQNDSRMCLCSFMAAEYDGRPDTVKKEVRTFADVNISWLAKVLTTAGVVNPEESEDRADAIYAAISGAQLVAKGRPDIATYDSLVENYRKPVFFRS